MSRPYLQLYDVSPKQALARYGFILAFVLGIGGSIALKVYDQHPFLVAGYAALVLIFYAVIAWMSGRIRLEPENIGDNCYYLGFLLTLSSLAYTLYEMADPTMNSGRPVDIPGVISGFGVALSSTIVGVFLRVLLMQMRPDFVAKEREIRADMNRSFTDFKKQLSTMMREMKSFSTESVQMASERDERMRKDTEQFVKDHHQALLDASEEFNERMKVSLSSVAESTLEKVEKAIEASSKNSLAVIEATSVSSLHAIEEARREILKMKDDLREQEMNSFEEMQSCRKLLKALLKEEETKFEAHSDEMEKFIRVTRRTADAMDKRLLGALEAKLVPAIEALSERLDQLPKERDFEHPAHEGFAGGGLLLATPEKQADGAVSVQVQYGLWDIQKKDS